MRTSFVCGLALASLVVAGCGKKPADTAQAAPPAASAPSPSSAAAPMPDVGKLETESVKAQGYGSSAAEAVTEAMKLALLQVNGATLNAETVTAKYGLDVTMGQDSASLRAAEFAEVVRQRSGGVIQNLRVVDILEPSASSPRFKVNVEANIAKFKASEDLKKIKVAVGRVRFDTPTVTVGDVSMSSSEVAAVIQQRVMAALVNTGRFAVLDRGSNPEVELELEAIAAGKAPSAETAKLGQAVSADIVWSAHVDTLGYQRHARKLQTSDRELVSYSGGWALTQKLVNVATRQLMMSEGLRGSAPSTEPTTMSPPVDGYKVLADMTDDMVNQVVASTLRRTFPVTVVARDGNNVILSQGGQAVRIGGHYAVVLLGNELKDPQTGQSLGHVETPCCELVVDRVTGNLSYGHLERISVSLDNVPTGGLQVRDEVRADRKVEVAKAPAAEAPTPGAAAVNPPAHRKTSGGDVKAAASTEPAPQSIPEHGADGKW